MKILFWVDLYPPGSWGGAGIFGSQLIRRLRERGIEFEVVTGQGAELLPALSEYEGVPVHRFPFNFTLWHKDLNGIPTILKGLREIFRRYQPDIVHFNTIQPSSFFYLRVPERREAKMVMTLHDPPAWKAYRKGFTRDLLAETVWVIAVSQAMRQDLCSLHPEWHARSSVILNGLEMPSIAQTASPEKTLRLFSAGRLVKDKGFDVMLEGMALVRDIPMRWSLAGNGPEMDSLQAQCTALGLDDRVEFLGHVPLEKVYTLMDASHGIVMPSRWPEPFGLVALQAAQRGRPIIASRVGGLPEIVVDEETGWLVEPEDVQGLARALQKLADEPERASMMGQRARQRTETVFSFDRVVKEYENLFRGILHSAPSASSHLNEIVLASPPTLPE